MKGLVMEGGAMRGVFTAGVTDVLMEHGIEFDGGIGVSAGACFGCNYKSKQIGRALRYNLTFCNNPNYVSFRSLFKTGELFNEEFAYDLIPNKLDVMDYDTYRENPMVFYVVCTDLMSGKPVYKRIDDVTDKNMKWLKASASMPLAAKIVEISGMKLLDGGVSDSIPLRYFIHKGYNKNIVILTQPDGYVKKKNRLAIAMKKYYKEYPNFVNAIYERHNVYNKTIEYVKAMEKAGKCLIICPDEALPVGRIEHNPEKLLKAYMMGREKAIKEIDNIMDYLKLR